MREKQRFYSLTQTGNVADLNIYGDITPWAWEELGEVSAVSLSRQLESIAGVSQINVHINSYGGEVAEGLAIYNALRRNPAKIVTTCDGMACSIASVIFMAGDERIMSESSVLMIHNAFVCAVGDAAELRKQADDVEKINEASKAAYLSRASIDEAELTQMMDAETFISPEEAFSMGFATAVETFDEVSAYSQSAKRSVIQKLLTKSASQAADDTDQFLKHGVNAQGAENSQEDTEQAVKDPDDDPDEPDDDQDDPDEPDDDPEKRPTQKQSFIQFLTMEVNQ